MYLFFIGNRPRSAKKVGAGALIGIFGLSLIVVPGVFLFGYYGPYGLPMLIYIAWCIFVIIAIIQNARKEIKK